MQVQDYRRAPPAGYAFNAKMSELRESHYDRSDRRSTSTVGTRASAADGLDLVSSVGRNYSRRPRSVAGFRPLFPLIVQWRLAIEPLRARWHRPFVARRTYRLRHVDIAYPVAVRVLRPKCRSRAMRAVQKVGCYVLVRRLDLQKGPIVASAIWMVLQDLFAICRLDISNRG